MGMTRHKRVTVAIWGLLITFALLQGVAWAMGTVPRGTWGTAEIVAFSLWDDIEAIRRFAGEDIDAMVLYPEDHDYLLSPPTLVHYRVDEW